MSKIVFVQFLRSEETFEFEIGIDKTVGELKAKIEKFFHIKLQNKLKIKHNACRSLKVLEDENENIKHLNSHDRPTSQDTLKMLL